MGGDTYRKRAYHVLPNLSSLCLDALPGEDLANFGPWLFCNSPFLASREHSGYSIRCFRFQRVASPLAARTASLFFGLRGLGVMSDRPLIANQSEVFAVLAFRQVIDQSLQLVLIDEIHPKRHLLETGDLQALAMFDRGDVIAGFEQARLRSRIEPCHPAPELLHVQLVSLQINQVQIRDLQFA